MALRDGIRKVWDTGIMVRVTNLGLGFVLMTLIVAIGATNTGNNGLYVLVSLFMGALVVSGVVSRRNVEKVVAALDGPDEVFAGVPARFTLTLRNEGRLPRRALLVKISGSSAPILFAALGPGESADRGVDLIFPKRGRRVIESLLVYSGYPIGLFRKGRLYRIGQERLVYPRVLRARAPRPESQPVDEGSERSRRVGRGAEVRNLREAAFGDDPRDVHWPQTARQGRFIVKERAAEEGRDAVVWLDAARPANAGPSWDAAFETAVSEAAGIALELLSRGDRVGLVGAGTFVGPGSGPAQRRALLAALALAAPLAERAAAPPPSARLAVYAVRPRSAGREAA